MNCPNCGAPVEGLTEYGDHACAQCGLAGPRDVLEALAKRLAPPDADKRKAVRSFIDYALRAAEKLAVSYVRGEVQPAAEYEWFMAAAGERPRFDRIERTGAPDVRVLFEELMKGK